MNAFNQIIAKISNPLEMTLCSPEELDKMRQGYPSVPEVYFEFMALVGWGDIGGMMIYSGLAHPEDLLDSPDAKIVLFGDNWQGSHYGFDLDDGGELIEITPDGEIDSVDHDFIGLMKLYAN